MHLTNNEIQGLREWLLSSEEDELWKLPNTEECDCLCCMIWHVVSKPRVDDCFANLYPAVRLTLKLYDRFGQCDTKLLKELYAKEIAKADG